MRKVLLAILIVVLIPVFLVTFTAIHELGHTVLARLLGDPNSVFYLAKFEEQGMCLGCNIYDASKLSWGGNVIVSLGGLLATQLVALTAVFFLSFRNNSRLLQRILSIIALGFAFLDVPVQAIQGLLYDLNDQVWPTNVDLIDVMLLLQVKGETSQLLLKGLLFALAVIYLWVFVALYKRSKIAQRD
jgi:hypothetical protein